MKQKICSTCKLKLISSSENKRKENKHMQEKKDKALFSGSAAARKMPYRILPVDEARIELSIVETEFHRLIAENKDVPEELWAERRKYKAMISNS